MRSLRNMPTQYRVPKLKYAIIGGSGTFAINFPEGLDFARVESEESGLVFETPFGLSPEFKIFSFATSKGREKVITCRMHGWRKHVSRADAARQVFWVLHEAGVETILSEGGVGSINHLLNPSDIVIPTDFIDHTQRKDISIVEGNLLIMREPICPDLHGALLKASREHYEGRVFERGIYISTEGPRFESPAEIRAFSAMGADIIGQSMVPEVYLARDIGACYASLQLVVNYAEGVVQPWDHDELKAMFYEQPPMIGFILLEALFASAERSLACHCRELRRPSLLQDEP